MLPQELGYPQTNGTAELRDAIAAMYPGATAAHVQVTNGGSEANYIALMQLVEPGDEVVMMMPNYMQIAGLARALGGACGRGRCAVRQRRDALAARSRRARRARHGAHASDRHLQPEQSHRRAPHARKLDEICRIAARVGAWVIVG